MMRKETIAKCAAALVLGSAMNSQAQFSYTTAGSGYSQGFDSLAGTGTSVSWTNDSTLDGWYLYTAAGNAITNYAAGTGTGTAGAFYSFGTTSTDRALGGLGSGGAYFGSPSSGSTAGYIAFSVTNNTAGLLSEFAISFDGEQWRNGGNTNSQAMTLQYGFGSSFASVTTWNTPGSTFDWSSPIVGSTAAATDGNTVGLVANRGGTIDGLTWNTGETLWIRWVEVNDTGNDHGLAIDDFTFTALAGLVSSGTTEWTAGSLGGDGTWSSSPDGNWDFGSDWDENKTALFDLLPGTITIDGVVNANFGMMFANADGNVITSGTLRLGGAVDVSGVTATINSAITGTSGLTKTGSGVLVLGGTNAFSGAVKINGGLVQIAEDANLGDAANDITFATGGGLRTISDVTLGSGRDITGSGVLDVADGTKLTINGAFNTAALTLANTGTVYLGGATRTVGNVTFNGAGTLDGAGTITASGFNASNLVGTARVLPSLSMGTANITVDVGSNGTLALDGNILTAVGIQKTGGGILELNGNNSAMFRVRLGATGADGGTVRIAKNTSLGANQMFFNGGTLEATSDLTGANSIGIGVSVGAVASAPAIFSGSNMTFTGSSGIFETVGSANRINVNNTTTFAGLFTQSGTTVGNGLIIGGSGTLKFTGNASGMTRATTVTDVATMVVDSSYGGAITVESGATLKGGGTLLGLLQISGVHAVGNSAGIQTASGGVSYLSGSAFEWELVANSSSNAGVNYDQLIVSGGSISIDSNAEVELVFNSAGSTVNWNDSFWDSDHTWTIVDNTGGGALSGIFGLNDASEWFDAGGFLLSVVNPGAAFELTASGGDIILNYYAVPIPEPSTVLLMGVSLAGLFLVRHRRVTRQ